jgi:hypothetical protein
MRSVVVYESMYGNTHTIAEGIASGLRDLGEVVVVPVGRVTPHMLDGTDLVVVGGPTHVHGMTSEKTRASAVSEAAKHSLTLDDDAPGPGLRTWLQTLTLPPQTCTAAFDTRLDANAALTGRASRGIARRLTRRGPCVLVEPESFLVTRATALVDGELERAGRWGSMLAEAMVARARVQGASYEHARLRTHDEARDHLARDAPSQATVVAHRTASSWR